MMQQPFYHLRPNKSIDRSLFLQTLIGLSRHFPLSEYQYTGFGSYLFDDFKLLHDTLGISKMVSLEEDFAEYHRANFNIPYKCIRVININSTNYLSDLTIDDNDHNIFWLDFVSPKQLGTQLADYATLLNILNPNDIVRITLNANPNALGNTSDPDKLQEIRLEELKRRVPDTYFPNSIVPEDVTTANYPITLLKILKSVSIQSLEDTPPYQSNFMFPLFSSVYADGQQMLTFTGIVLDSHDKKAIIRDILTSYSHNNFLWDKPCRLEIPALSIREITELNKLLPNPDIGESLLEHFPFIFSSHDRRAMENYIAYYKYYPSYHQVSF